MKSGMHPVRTAARRSRLYILATLLAVTACSKDESPPVDLQQAFQWNLQGLLSKNSEVRYRAFDMYRRNWSYVREYVSDLANSSEIPERMAGAYLVARLGTEQDLPMLHSFLGDDLFEVRRMAIGGVVRLEDVASVPALVKFLDKAKYEEVRLILNTLNRVDPSSGEEACVQRAADERWAHRRAAAEALGMLDSQSSASLLERLLADPVWLVQMDAAEAVGRRRHKGGHHGLLKLLTSDQWAVRAAAARALGSLGRTEDLDTIKKLTFGDDNKKVRIAAVESLPGFHADQAIGLIKDVLQEETLHYKVHKAAFRSLLRMGAGMPAELFQALLRGDDERLANLARAVLKEQEILGKPGPATSPGKE